MKLVIGGASGFLGSELVRQALSHPAITSVIGLSRRQTALPSSTPGANKLKALVCDNFEHYPESIKQELQDVDACIWYRSPPSSPFGCILLTEAQDHCCDADEAQILAMGRYGEDIKRLGCHCYQNLIYTAS